jgi:hypothetical protein
MRNVSILATIAAVLAAACGGSSSAPLKEQARDAMPSRSTVQTSAPGSAAPGVAPEGPQSDSAIGAASSWKDVTVGVAATFNLSTVFALGLVETITAQEPTSCDATSCTWGPGHGALDSNTFKLVVTKNGANFDYALSGEPLSRPGSGFITVLSGSATPSGTPHHGSGNFTVDFDAAAKLDHPGTDTGKLSVVYTNVGPANIQVSFPGAKDHDHPGQVDNIVYKYQADPTGGGDLDVAVHNTTSDVRFSVHSRWKSDGQGRADVEDKFAYASVNYDVTLSECWGIAPFNTVYFSSNNAAAIGQPNGGSESACAFTPASPSTQTAP